MDCGHPSCEATQVDDIEIVACRVHGTLGWFRHGRTLAADVAVRLLFGDFDLVAELEAVSAPGRSALVYRPGSRRGRRSLACLPPGRWWRASPDLWLCRDRGLLLVSTPVRVAVGAG
jgi:hypothetical protein